MKRLVLMVLATIAVQLSANAINTPKKEKGSKNENTSIVIAAGCSPPTYRSDLDLNNVRAMIHTGGDMWYDLVTSSRYEVPKGSGKTAMFAGALWMGGQDVNGQLKIAGQMYRTNGVDFWTGPLDLVNSEIDATTCNEWDRHFELTRQEVEIFRAWFNSPNRAVEFPGYQVPQSILDWPWQGDPSKGQAEYLAPFVDVNDDGEYNPLENGDYPKYDLDNDIDCKTDRTSKLYGDLTLWWIFNDKGNAHGETGGVAIGMEIHAQAFSFATNDDVNNMTFYNYRLINRSTFTLTNTYFGVFSDADLGFFDDDFVGCDVMRGLGYAYNGVAVDGSGGLQHYGENPPAIGVDFFEGPYQDNDSLDNDTGIYFNQALNGLGYGDGIKDNERFGMRRFIFFNRLGASYNTDPENGSDYYNYLRGIWRDGSKMLYGGNGHQSGGGDVTTPADFMFPDDSDQEFHWGTKGKTMPRWSEITSTNPPGDRRFLHSAGPFTLKSGAVNDITYGVVYARALSGGPLASVAKLKIADDKAQQLFSNCFRVLNGPDAPDADIVELDKELIIKLSNTNTSNNYLEKYEEIDPSIPNFVTDLAGNEILVTNKSYKFQGYQIFQVKNTTVSASDIYNPDLARIVAQCDLKDTIGRLINFRFDEDLNSSVPQDMTLQQNNNGVFKTFKITEDLFATGDRRLVNHKQYYYYIIAYGHNNYKTFDSNDPLAYDGQKLPYISSRKGSSGAIKVYTAIPHKPAPTSNGTVIRSQFGETPEITRIEGMGNGGRYLDMTEYSENQILNSADHKLDFVTYKKGAGPVDIKVIDPLNLVAGDFELKFNVLNNQIDTARWTLREVNTGNIIESGKTIKVGNEQITEYGFSVRIEQALNPGVQSDPANGYVGSTVIFNNPDRRWLSGIQDSDGATSQNWIRSGTSTEQGIADYVGKDDQQQYENMLVNFFAPYSLTALGEHYPAFSELTVSLSQLSEIKSVDVVITSDKSKWTRVCVIESQADVSLAENGAQKGYLRKRASVDKDGKPDGSNTEGMSWFPGYAINVETGERLNMAFSEDSWLTGENGKDMLWNPSASAYGKFGEILFGGKHYIYVFHGKQNNGTTEMPIYDEAAWMYNNLKEASLASMRNVWRNCMWVGLPLLAQGENFLSNTARVQLRISRKYQSYKTASTVNNDYPLYRFSTKGMEPLKNNLTAAESALDLIHVVPNPYYAFSSYEGNQLDNRVKVINLPDECVVTIYTVNGTLVRQFKKADKTLSSIEWNLTNTANIPIAGGVYLVHVNVPGVGEKVVKWFGVLRPIDLETF